MIETLKKELLPGMTLFDLRTTLEEISISSKTDVSMKICSKKERNEECIGGVRAREIFSDKCLSQVTIGFTLRLRA